MAEFSIAVYGANGHTARFVVRELERRRINTRLIARGRSIGPAPHSHDDWFIASCDAPDELDAALKGVDAVINCAGPFADTAPAIVEAALRANCHYFDITAEQRSVRQTLATYDTDAREHGVVVMPAVAFYGGLADLLATLACADLDEVNEILIGVALDHWHPTPGSRRTGERNTARRLIVSDRQLTPLPALTAPQEWIFPAPFGKLAVKPVPLAEIISISRHLSANRIESYMNEAPLQDLRSTDTPAPRAVDDSGRSSQRFLMDVSVQGDRSTRRVIASGRDIYAVTAPLVVEACVAVLCREQQSGGTYSPAQVIEPKQFFQALSSSLEVQWIAEADPLRFVTSD